MLSILTSNLTILGVKQIPSAQNGATQMLEKRKFIFVREDGNGSYKSHATMRKSLCFCQYASCFWFCQNICDIDFLSSRNLKTAPAYRNTSWLSSTVFEFRKSCQIDADSNVSFCVFSARPHFVIFCLLAGARSVDIKRRNSDFKIRSNAFQNTNLLFSFSPTTFWM